MVIWQQKKREMQIKNFQNRELSSDVAVKFRKTTLDNGLRIITEEIPYSKSFALGISIHAGSRDESNEYCGAAHFLEHAAFRRTNKRTSRQIASGFESIGAYSNAYTTKEVTCFYARALTPNFRKTFEILFDVVFNPAFNKSDIEKERTIILEEIKSYDDEPEELIFDYADKLLYGSHPLSNPIVGTLDSVGKIDSEALLKFYKNHYTPGNIIITLAGNVSHDELTNEVIKVFGTKKTNGKQQLTDSSGQSSQEITPFKPQRLEEVRSFQQTHILLANRVPGINSPDRYRLAVLNVMFGDGMSSRLNQKLREQHGIAYSVYSTLQLMSDCGGLYVYIATDKKKAAKAEKLLTAEFNKLLEQKLIKPELQRSKEQLKSNSIMALESLSVRMQNLSKSEFVFGRQETIDSIIGSIDSVSMEHIEELIEKYMNLKNWHFVIFNPNK
ncbi:MAG: hypothetical protein HW421_2648 [Ignavibacteria bacterium]|nr:hypothetical protein [Ignavibacteria bacterium]